MIPRQRTRAANTADDSPLLQRVFTLKLSVLSLFGIGAASLVAVGWVFALGIIIGRGFSPEEKLPVLGRLVPPSSAEMEDENPEIFKPEDLGFLTELKRQPVLSSDEQPAAPETGAAVPATGTTRTAPGTTSAAGTPPAVTQAGTPAAEAPRPASTERFAYVFQVIAYKKPEQADAFRDKLEQAGLRTRLNIDKDGSGKARFYRIQVLVTGTEADAEEARAVLARHGIKEPFLASRKPAGR